jgi:hypothetical protein
MKNKQDNEWKIKAKQTTRWGGTFLDKSLFKVQITCDTRSYWGGEEKQRQRRES